jgi:hypothetical protein
MTPKEKAEELILKYLRIDNNTSEWFNTHIAKQCALVAVDETIKSITVALLRTLNEDIRDVDVRGKILLDLIDYWSEVKQEIEKL